MSSDEKWLNLGNQNRETSMNSKVILTSAGVNDFATAQLSPTFEQIIFGDYTKWCSSLIYFPYDLTANGQQGKLRVSGIDINVDCYLQAVDHNFGYTLGEYHYVGKYGDFRDYEPYTQLQIYLPYYGFIDLNIADVINKYIQFRLNVDFMTGQAMYVIGVSNSSVSAPNAPYRIGIDDTYTTILSKHVFTLGVNVPLGQTGMAETIRNITLGAVKGATNILTHAVLSGTGGTGGKYSTKTITTARNPKTGRQIRTGTETKETSYDNRAYHRGQMFNSCFDVAIDTLNNMAISPSTDKPNNTFVDNICSRSVKIVRRYANVVDIDNNYKSLYGIPLGETRQLSNVHGYTEVSAIHFEGSGFGNATSKELAMIEEEFSNGIILP